MKARSLADELLLWLRESIFSSSELDAALEGALQLHKGMRVLELGCGRGRHALALAKQHPHVAMTVLDKDPRMVQFARRAAARERLKWGGLPQDVAALKAGERFDRVYSVSLFHHLSPAERHGTLQRVETLLKPRGKFVLADFCRPRGLREHGQALLHFPLQRGWLEHHLPRYFRDVEMVRRVPGPLGPVGVFVCRP